MKYLKFTFVGYPQYTVYGYEDAIGYDDKGKKSFSEFQPGEKYWVIDQNNKCIAEYEIQAIIEVT